MRISNPLATLPTGTVIPPVEFYEFYKHTRNGNLYKFIKLIYNATNVQEGQVMVEYVNVAGLPFVREVNEFLANFTPHPLFELSDNPATNLEL